MRIFVSYSRRDAAAADSLVSDLEGRGFEVVIDRRDLPYGEEWQKELADFIRTSDTVVWLASPDSVVSRWCNWELGEVQRISKRLVPVRIAPLDPEKLPEALGRIHVLPVDGVYSAAQHLDTLVKVLETDHDWIRTHTRLADRAAEWVSRNRSADRLLRGRALADAEAWRDGKPASAPSPGNDTLDLLLQSRRAANRGLRVLVGVALAAVVVTAGLAAAALWQANEARAQRDVAETATQQAVVKARDAELQGARVATSLAPNLLANGEVDPALLLLLTARRTYGADPAPDELPIAFHEVIETAQGREVYELPANAGLFAAGSGLYFFDPEAHDLWRYDGNGAPAKILDELSGASPIVALGDSKGGLIVVRGDRSVARLPAGASAAEPSGAFPADPAFTGTVGVNEEIAFYPDGVVTWHVPEPDTLDIVDTISGAGGRFTPTDYEVQFYYATDEGHRYLIQTGGMADELDRTLFTLDISDDTIAATPIGPDADLASRGLFNECLRRGLGPSAPYSAAAVQAISYALFHPICWVVGGDKVLVSDFSGTSAGIDRNETLVAADGTHIDIDKYPPFSTKADQFTWLGVEPQSASIAGIVNRDVAVASAYNDDLGYFSEDLAQRESEAPALARLLPDQRIALMEPRARRLVVYSYAEHVRPATIDASEPAIMGGALFTPLNAGSCVGYALNELVNREVATESGTITVTGGTMSSGDGPPGLTLADGRTISFGVESGCLQLSADRSQVLVINPDQLLRFDLGRLIAGASFDDARLDAPPGWFQSAFFLPDGDIVTATYTEEVLRWHRGGDDKWSSSTLYLGENPTFYAEPNADGTQLIIIQSLGDGNVGGLLYSVSARKVWRQLGSDYKWFGAGFGLKGEILVGNHFEPQRVYRLPSLDELAAEAQASLPRSCAPSDEDARSSPCWPAWL